jgi:hypothetical protein
MESLIKKEKPLKKINSNQKDKSKYQYFYIKKLYNIYCYHAHIYNDKILMFL